MDYELHKTHFRTEVPWDCAILSMICHASGTSVYADGVAAVGCSSRRHRSAYKKKTGLLSNSAQLPVLRAISIPVVHPLVEYPNLHPQ